MSETTHVSRMIDLYSYQEFQERLRHVSRLTMLRSGNLVVTSVDISKRCVQGGGRTIHGNGNEGNLMAEFCFELMKLLLVHSGCSPMYRQACWSVVIECGPSMGERPAGQLLAELAP